MEGDIDAAETEQVLAPGNPVQIGLAVGQSQFLRFTCDNGPADAIVTLKTYSENADPLLFLSLDPDTPPNFAGNDASSFAHWLEDSSGHHYAKVKGVGPRGGMLGLFNMRRFASEALDAILILRCSSVIAFDGLFWDHLTTSGVCPEGIVPLEDGRGDQAGAMCSGHGECEKHGECSCDSGHSGPACEHKKYDVVGNQDFKFDLGPGQYQYFRVHIPPRFAGGYVQVNLKSSMPMVMLMRSDSLPSKTKYDLSNFDDWVNHRNQTDLKLMVPASKGTATAPMGGAYGMNGPPPEIDDNDGMGYGYDNSQEDAGYGYDSQRFGMPGNGNRNEVGTPASGSGRRALEDLMSNLSEAWSPSDIFRQASQRQELPSTHTHVHNRRLASSPQVCASLEKLLPRLAHPLCNTAEVNSCSSNCMDCLNCVQTSDDRMPCSASCQACKAPKCNQALAACASDTTCSGPEASKCESSCGSNCISCLDTKDQRCELCRCCESCLPLSSKCHQDGTAWESRYVFIAVYHHRRYSEPGVLAQGKVDVALSEDEYFASSGGTVPKSWTSDLYDTFLDLRYIERADSEAYPDGEQFMYDLEITHEETVHQEVRLFRDRLTLLHLKNVLQLQHMSLSFKSGPKITHVLTSSRAAPRTLFDFDDAPVQGLTDLLLNKVVIHARRRQDIWCAIFAKEDGYVQITSVAHGNSEEKSGNASFPVVLLFCSVCGFLVLSGKGRSLLQRLVGMVTTPAGHQSTASLGEGAALQGYSGSDAVDQSVEDQYLHRGGLGDEGL